MTRAARITKSELADAAEIVAARGVVVVYEVTGPTKTCRIAPEPATIPLGASEKDKAACDRAFGVDQ